MTELLEKAIEKARSLPADRQDQAAEILLTIVTQNAPDAPQLTEEQANEVHRRMENPTFASEAEVTALYQKYAG